MVILNQQILQDFNVLSFYHLCITWSIYFSHQELFNTAELPTSSVVYVSYKFTAVFYGVKHKINKTSIQLQLLDKKYPYSSESYMQFQASRKVESVVKIMENMLFPFYNNRPSENECFVRHGGKLPLQ